MTVHYGDFKARTSVSSEAYPISYAASGIFGLSPLAIDMMDLLPSYYYYGNNNRRIMEMLSVVLSKNQDYTSDITDQLFVNTATWGLRYWEEVVGLPVNDGSLDYSSRRSAIMAKLRDCSSKECFVNGLEDISNGSALITDLDPAVNPYQINIELNSTGLTYEGPTTAPTASTLGIGNLNGDYTYRVTYEMSPVNIPSYISLFPYGSYEGILPSDFVNPQRQLIKVTGSGDFYLTMPGYVDSLGPFTENSDAADIVSELNIALNELFGDGAVSSPDESATINTSGVLVVFDGEYSLGYNLPLIEVFSLPPSTIVGSVAVITPADYSLPQIAGETSSGNTPIRINEKQIISVDGTITSGSFKIKYNTSLDQSKPPVFEVTKSINYSATSDDIQNALVNLPSIYLNAIKVTGGPLPYAPVEVEFLGPESGYPQNLLRIDNSQLVGGSLDINRSQLGSTSYVGSESNTITTSNNKVVLSNVPRSSDGALRRNIYRKKSGSYNNRWVYVGSIEDNYTTTFTDNVSDLEISEKQNIYIFGSGTFKLRFDGKTTAVINSSDTGASIAAKIQSLAPTDNFASIDVSGTAGSVGSVGATISFSGGDVAGQDVPTLEIVSMSGVTGFVVNSNIPRLLTDKNTAFSYLFQRVLNYIYVTKPAHIRIRELRGFGFRAGINAAGDTV